MSSPNRIKQFSLTLIASTIICAGTPAQASHAATAPSISAARPQAMCVAPPPYAGTDWTNTTPGSSWIGLALYGGNCYNGYDHQLAYAANGGSYGAVIQHVEKHVDRPRQWGAFNVSFRNSTAYFEVEVMLRGEYAGLLRVNWQYQGASGTDYFRHTRESSLRLPRDGSYLDSCDYVVERNNLLTAECASPNGEWIKAQLKYPASCTDDITNLDGHLICSNRNFQRAATSGLVLT